MGTTNVVVGIQATNTVKIGAYGAAEGSATDIGYIKGGVKIERDETQYEVKVDQILATIARPTTNVGYKVSFSMAEATLANMAVAFGMATSSVSGSTISFGIPSSAEEKTMYINVKGPGPGTRKYTFYKVRPTGKAPHAYKIDNETLYDVEFEILYDATQTSGAEFGICVDTGADTTPPTIVITSPAAGGSLDAAGKTPVVLTITETNTIDQSSIVYGDGDNATISIYKEGGGIGAPTLVAGAITYDTALKTITFIPTSVWGSGNFDVIVSTGLKDNAGNHLAAQYATYLIGS